MPAVIMEFKDLSFGYQSAECILKNINVQIYQGSRLALVGANGSGKSTLLMHLNGLLKPTSGVVEFLGQGVDYGSKGQKRLRQKVGYVFQNPDHQLVAPTVEQDLAFGPLNLGLNSQETRHVIGKIARELGLSHLLDQPVYRLSFGQKKLVSLAGVLAMTPEVLVLDEPTLGLDAHHQALLEVALKEFHDSGKTLIFSTHDWDFLAQSADQVAVLHGGVLVEQGDPWKILSNDLLMVDVGLRPCGYGQVAKILGLTTLDHGKIMASLKRALSCQEPGSKVQLDLRRFAADECGNP